MSAVGGATSPGGRSAPSSSFGHEDHHGDSAGASAVHGGGAGGVDGTSHPAPNAGASVGGGSHDDGRTTAERHAGGETTAERHAGGRGRAASYGDEPSSPVGREARIRDDGYRDDSHGSGDGESNDSVRERGVPVSRHAGVASNVGDAITGLTNFGIDGMAKANAYARMREVGSWIVNDVHGEMRELGLDHEAVGHELQSPWRNIAKSADLLPSGTPERWVGKVTEAMEAAGRAGTRANLVSIAAAPAIGLVQGFGEARPDATLGERVASVVGGGLRELDDSLVSGAAGAAAGFVTAATGPGAVVASTAAGITAAHYYEGSEWDRAADAGVDRLEVRIAATVDGVMDHLGSMRALFHGS